MNKFAKGCLITAGIMLAVGMLLGSISFACGGRRVFIDNRFFSYGIDAIENVADNWNINTDNWIWTWADFDDYEERFEEKYGSQFEDKMDDFSEDMEEFGDKMSDYGDEWSDYFDDKYDDYVESNVTDLFINGEHILDGEPKVQLNADDCDKLELNLGAGTFTIEEKDTDDGKIDLSFKGIGRCDYSITNSTVEINGFKGLNHINLPKGKNVMKIRLPKGMDWKDVTINGGAGVIDVSTLDSESVSINLGAGRIVLEDIKTDELTAIIGAGEMEAQDVDAKNADIQIHMGNAIFKGNVSKDFNASCDMGSLKLRLEGSEKDHNYDLHCAAGNFNMNGFNVIALSKDKTIDNDADSNYVFSCNMGDMSVKFED